MELLGIGELAVLCDVLDWTGLDISVGLVPQESCVWCHVQTGSTVPSQ
jgi:hypothetical protein